MKKVSAPPPFHGPGDPLQAIYYQHGYPIDGGGIIIHQKTKKSLVEKIGRTLDKLATGKEPRSDPPSRSKQYPAWVYPVQYNGYHYVPNAPAAAVPLYSWDNYLGSNEHLSLDSPAVHPGGGWCVCQEFLYGTQRGRPKQGGRCKRCKKVRRTLDGLNSTRIKSEGRVPLPKSLVYRDPYEFRKGYAEDEWQSYWEQNSVESSFKESEKEKSANRPISEQQPLPGKTYRVGSSSPASLVSPALPENNVQTREVTIVDVSKIPSSQEDQDKAFDDGSDHSTDSSTDSGSSKKSSDSSKRSILDPGLNPYELNGTRTEGEGSCEPEPVEEEASEDADEKETEEQSTDQDTSPKFTPKPKLTVAEYRYRKYQRKFRRKVSMTIDEVILEEDEDALAAENLEVISVDPPMPVKSILKRSPPPSDHDSDPEEKGGQRKGVRFSQQDEVTNDESDDEWNGYDKVIVSHNLAEEILDEIYGKTVEQEEPNLPPRSFAEEILEELYGRNYERLKEEEEVSGPQSAPSELAPRKDNSATFAELSRQFSRLESSTSSLFHDTTRLRLHYRPALSAVFCHEAPDITAKEMRSVPRRRPRDPPPPPPPVAQVLLPLVPPRKFFPFSEEERRKIDSVINRNMEEDEEEEEEEVGDEFSEDEFDDVSTTYENLVRTSPEGAEDVNDDNVYDQVMEFIEEDSLEIEEDEPPPLPKNPPPMDDVTVTSSTSGLIRIKEEENPPTESLTSHTVITEVSSTSLIKNSGDRTIIFTSAAAASSTTSPPLEDHQILISSSSWINVQGDPPEEQQHSFSAAPVIEEPSPVKPPRLKKLARLQQQQQQLLDQARETSADGSMKKFAFDMSHRRRTPRQSSRPEISAPVLVTTTLNPNDVESHQSLPANNHPIVEFRHHSICSGEKISLRDLRRFALGFPSFGAHSSSYGYNRHGIPRRSSYYETSSLREDIYEDERSNQYSDHIYEEIPDRYHHLQSQPNRPLPPVPSQEKLLTPTRTRNPAAIPRRTGSFFEGASKYEILHYLKSAKDRIGYGDFEIELDDRDYIENSFIGKRNHNHRVSAISNVSDSSTSSVDSGSSSGDSSVLLRGPSFRTAMSVDIERTDSGVGSETSSKCGKTVQHRRNAEVTEQNCFDCDQRLDQDNTNSQFSQIVCKRCAKRRSERKEIITEIVETEIKYGRDLRIIMEEFNKPMLVAGLLTADQLAAIFLNTEELIEVNTKFTEVLKDAIEIAQEQGDEDLGTVHMGKLFLNSLDILPAFEAYCTRQASASLLLTTLEKEKELLKIFLKVSQMENSMLRRMNLSSFLMVPVQRVTKYPLLLARLYKVTPHHHEDRNAIKVAQEKIEAALEQMNKDAKDVVNTQRIWKKLPKMSSPTKTVDIQVELRVRKMALDLLGWKSDETRFPLEGRILYMQPNEANWKKVWTTKLAPINALLAVWSTDDLPEVSPNKELIFPQETANIRDASLLLVREKNSKFSLVRDPLPLEQCVICCEPDWDDYFEIQELSNKESFVFKGEEPDQTQMWFQTLQFYTQSLGGWRKRRKGLGNIMIDPNMAPAAAEGAAPSGSEEAAATAE